jgi:dTDP-4-amino-4,6-dideoxygalactose transaminase
MSKQHVGDVPLANPTLSELAKQQVREVLDSGNLAAGDVVREFEREFAAFHGVDHAIATANGTTALHAALSGLGIGTGDTVVTTPFSFIATANAVQLAGGRPVFADVDSDTANIDPDAVEQTIKARDDSVDAILPVHLYGCPAEMDRLREIADRHDAALIEDAAQAHGATYHGEPVGAIGDVGCFSFYPTKNMTTGEGGMVITDRDDVARRVRSFVNHGRTPTDGNVHERVGHNFRMPNTAAAIGRVQLQRLPDYVTARRDNAAALTEALADTEIAAPVEPARTRHAYHQYTVRTDDRDSLQAALEEFGIGTGIYYPTPIHRQPAYEDYETTAPVAERLAQQVLSLPVHPNLSREERNAVTTAIEYVTTE